MSIEALALGAVRDAFGEPVTIDPDGAAVTVKAVVRRPDDAVDAFGVTVTAPTLTLEILAADLEAAGVEISAGDVIETSTGERRLVKADPRRLDGQRLVVLIDTVAEEA